MNESFSPSPTSSTDLPADVNPWVLASPPADLWPNELLASLESQAPVELAPEMHEPSLSDGASVDASDGAPSVLSPREPEPEAVVAEVTAPEEGASSPASLDAEAVAAPPALPEPEAPAHAAVAAPPPSKTSRRARHVLLPVVCALATLAGVALATKANDSRRAARTNELSAEVDGVRAEQERTRAELEKQAAALAAAREALRAVKEQQKQVAERTTVEIARVEDEQVHLARDIAATKHAQARTEERVYQLSEALKLIDWATTGGNASEAIAKAATPRRP